MVYCIADVIALYIRNIYNSTEGTYIIIFLCQEEVKSSYENQSDNRRAALLPSIVQEIVIRRVYWRHLLKTLKQDSLLYFSCETRLNILKQILVCLYGTSGSIWNRYSNVWVFEEINKLSRLTLLKTKDIVQRAALN